ncbi:MAG: serine hydroxymethyltransferase, partial [Nitrososphaerales archaeon]
ERANVIVNRQLIPGDIKAGRHYMRPGGLRIGTSEVTRLGMKEHEMGEIARLIARIVVQKQDSAMIKASVEEMRLSYQNVHYAFETDSPAYKYVRVR